MLVRRTRETGDTLVEVVIALAILSVVLTSSLAVAVRSYQLGRTATNRTSLATEAQQQMEALRAMRDNHTWAEFLKGSNSADTPYKGVLNGRVPGPVSCAVTSPCMHLELKDTDAGSKEYVPIGGSMVGSVAHSYIEIAVDVPAGTPPPYVDLTVNYGYDSAVVGGPQNTGHIKTRLTNMQFVSQAVPGPLGDGNAFAATCIPGVTCRAPGAPIDPAGAYQWKVNITNLSNAQALLIVGCDWNMTDGINTMVEPPNTACDYGDPMSVTYPTPLLAGLPPYPQACVSPYPGSVIWTNTLTEHFSDGSSKSYSFNIRTPRCPRVAGP